MSSYQTTTFIWQQHVEESDDDDLYYDAIDTNIAHDPPKSPMSLDLITCIDNMFRILDLGSEQGSGGLGMNVFKLEEKSI